VGDAATAEALQRFDADGDPIAIGDAKWYSKGKLPKTYNTPEAYPVDSGLSRCSMLSDRIGAVAKAGTNGEGAVARGI